MTVESIAEAADRQRRLEEVLAAYFEAEARGPTPDRQRLFADHPDLAADLVEFFDVQEKLHAAAVAMRTSSDTPNGSDAKSTDSGELTQGRIVGDYEILDTIARGGMGVVYRARQRSLNRLVALKMLRNSLEPTSDEVRRFQLDAELIAIVDHPNIVPIYEIGVHEGHRFFSMKLAEGGSLADRINDYANDQRGAAQLVATVARAIHHSHERHVLHRDLKPSNIVIDERGQPLVVDFGLAMQTDAQSIHTRTGLLPGTPAYMSPEQVDGHRGAVSPATDVHGLGTILYALLTGRPPFKGATPWETLARVRDLPPERPSGIRRSVDRDLETICLKCLEKEPGRRYPSAQALAEDLDRWLEGRPIMARRIGPVGRAWRLGRRHPLATALAVAVLVLAISNTVVLFRGARAYVDLVRKDPIQPGLVQQVRDASTAGSTSDVAIAWRFWTENRLDKVRELLHRYRRAPGEPDHRGFAWRYLDRLAHVGRAPLVGHQGAVYSAAFSPDGMLLATAGQDRTIRLWNPVDGTLRSTLVGHTDEVNSAVFSPDGRTMASAGDDKTVRIWDVQSGRNIKTLTSFSDKIVGVVFSPNGKQIYACGRGGIANAWLVGTWIQWQNFTAIAPTAQGLAISPDGTTLATTAKGTDIHDLRTGESVAGLGRLDLEMRCAAFTHDGTFLTTAGPQNELAVWATKDWTRQVAWTMFDDGLESVAISPDDKIIAATGRRGMIHLRYGTTGAQEAIATGQPLNWCVAFAPDGRTLATANSDATVRLWDLRRDRMRISVAIPTVSLAGIAFSPDSTELVSADHHGQLSYYDIRSGRLKSSRQLNSGSPLSRVALSNDSRWIAAESSTGQILVWNLPDGRLVREEQAPGQPSAALAISPDGRFVARSGLNESTVFWGGERGGLTSLPSTTNFAVLFSSANDRLSTWDWNSKAPLLWDTNSASSIRAKTAGHASRITSQAFSDDGATLATGGNDGTVILWDVAKLEPVAEFGGLATMMLSLAFTPDGRTLAVGGGDRLVSLWDVATTRRLVDLHGHSGPVSHVRFSPDGQTMATCAVAADASGTELFLWSANPPE